MILFSQESKPWKPIHYQMQRKVEPRHYKPRSQPLPSSWRTLRTRYSRNRCRMDRTPSSSARSFGPNSPYPNTKTCITSPPSATGRERDLCSYCSVQPTDPRIHRIFECNLCPKARNAIQRRRNYPDGTRRSNLWPRLIISSPN